MKTLKQNYQEIKKRNNAKIDANKESALIIDKELNQINSKLDHKQPKETRIKFEDRKSELEDANKVLRAERHLLRQEIKDAKPNNLYKTLYKNAKKELHKLRTKKNDLTIQKTRKLKDVISNEYKRNFSQAVGNEPFLKDKEIEISEINEKLKIIEKKVDDTHTNYLKYYLAPLFGKGTLALLAIIGLGFFFNHRAEVKEINRQISKDMKRSGFFKTYNKYLNKSEKYKLNEDTDNYEYMEHKLELFEKNHIKGIDNQEFIGIVNDYLSNIPKLVGNAKPRTNTHQEVYNKILQLEEIAKVADKNFSETKAWSALLRKLIDNKELGRLAILMYKSNESKELNKYLSKDVFEKVQNTLANSVDQALDEEDIGHISRLNKSVFNDSVKEKIRQGVFNISKTALKNKDLNTLYALVGGFDWNILEEHNGFDYDFVMKDFKTLLLDPTFHTNEVLVEIIFKTKDVRVFDKYKNVRGHHSRGSVNKVKDSEQYILIKSEDYIKKGRTDLARSVIKTRKFYDDDHGGFFSQHGSHTMKNLMREEARRRLFSKHQYGQGASLLMNIKNSEKEIENVLTELWNQGRVERVHYFINAAKKYVRKYQDSNKFSSAFKARVLKEASMLEKQGKISAANTYRFFVGDKE